VKDDDGSLPEAAPPVRLLTGSERKATAAPESSHVMRILEAARKSVWASVVVLSTISTYTGVVYWIVQGWLAGVVMSVLIPGFGLISMLWSLGR
jgi:cytochrome c oxidase subunit IV